MKSVCVCVGRKSCGVVTPRKLEVTKRFRPLKWGWGGAHFYSFEGSGRNKFLTLDFLIL